MSVSISRCARPTARLALVGNTVRRTSALPKRTFASSSTSRLESQSSKICTAPFRLPPQDAIERMHIVGLMASGQLSNIVYAGLLRLFGPGISNIAKEFGFGETLTMKGMKAVLYPIWRIDAIFEGGVESEKKRKEKDAYLAVEEGYVPGNPFAPLSYLSFSVPPLPDDLQPYNPDRDLIQLGEGFEVVHVPFTATPLGLLDRVREEVGRRTTWNGIRFDESKWTEQLLAMYPVMFPIYIAEFEHKTEERTHRYQVVVDAHDAQIKNCRITWPPPPELVKAGRFTNNYYINPAPFFPTTHFFIPSSMTPKDESPITSESVAEKFLEWISPPPGKNGRIVPSPLSGTEPENGIDWDDVRVQSWNAEERHDNGAYIEKSVELNKAIKSMQDFAEFSNRLGPDQTEATGTIITLGGKGGTPRIQQKQVSEMRRDMEKDVARLRAMLQDIKPDWLKEWEKAKDFVKQAGRS